MSLFDDLKPIKDEKKSSTLTMCKCSNCGWKGSTKGLETEIESEGWEYPQYTIHLCPECDDGGLIDDYWEE